MWISWLIPVLSWALSAFFTLGSWFNLFDESSIADYRKWGYPGWFHFVTAAMELATAALLIEHTTRLFGAALGALVMVGAIATLVGHCDYIHAALPTTVLMLLLVVAWTS
jgi:hypothetical protein